MFRVLGAITLDKGFYNIDVDGVQRGFAGNLYCIWTYVAEKSFLTELSNFDLSTNFLYYFSEKQIQDDWKVSNKAKFSLKPTFESGSFISEHPEKIWVDATIKKSKTKLPYFRE